MKRVAVYCGSRVPKNQEIVELAKNLGSFLAEHKLTLVYGGGKVGIMGVIADACLANNGEVIGVIPTAIKEMEVAHTGITELHETQDMHTRKALIESLSDLFVVLPGGFGTLDEFFEILTWRQLGYHNKPIVLVNKNGYFDGLEQFIGRGLEEDFLRTSIHDLFTITTNFNDTAEMIRSELEF
ncbi:MAG: TIGR00730 family Rossman fold protein [Balneolaceae bacterium]|nr:TIGR00730 family Rossman fold protein [Balneolaceae bacterium]